MAEDAAPNAPLNVLVIGMHRSGTSAISEALLRAGFSAGMPGQEAEPKFDNPRGFFERKDVVAFNEGLLRALGWPWDAPSAAAPPEPPDRPAVIKRGRDLVDSMLSGPVPWTTKDPRLCLLLPYWRRILADRFVVVVPWRPIDEIAWSLSVRDGLPIALGVALTAAYMRHLAAGLQGLPVAMVDYPALVDEPGAVLPLLLGALRDVGVTLDFDEAAAVSAIDPALRRSTRPSDPPVAHLLSSQTRTLVETWPQGRVKLIRRFDFEPNEPAPWEEALLHAHRRLRFAQQANAQLRARISELETRSA